MKSVDEVFRDLRSELRWNSESVDALFRRWQDIVAAVVDGYQLSYLDDYDEDLVIRSQIERLLRDVDREQVLMLKARLAPIDEAFMRATVRGRNSPQREGWWWQRVPKHPGPELLNDLLAEHRI